VAGLDLADDVPVGANVALAVATRSLKQAQRGARVLSELGLFVGPAPLARAGRFGTLPNLGAHVIVSARADRRFVVRELEAALVASTVIRPNEWDDVAIIGLPGRPGLGIFGELSQAVYESVNRTVAAVEQTVVAVGDSAERVGSGAEVLGKSGILEALVFLAIGLGAYLGWKALSS
jgi:hypothetical protein